MHAPKLARLLACGALTALLSACSSVPPASTTASDTSTESAMSTASTDGQWTQQRQLLADEFAQLPNVTSTIRDDGALLIRLPAAEGFAADSSEITPQLQTLLTQSAPLLAAAPNTEITIVGHTDSVGSETYNLQLSIRRAEAVMNFLHEQGIPLTRLLADGHGESEPIADNRDLAGRALNRRVEFIVRPFH